MAELLAPAGQPGSAYAAFHYGADAVYLGLSQFSARASAVNFTPEELATLVGHARSLTPRRKIYLTLNTLVKDGELADAMRTLGLAVEAGVDAVIVQDLGIAALVRKNFRALANFHLHASTQLAVHSPEGVRQAAGLGFDRVTLARELTFREIVRIVETAQKCGVESETFIHGTLCYSYSGLCLFSGLIHGQSGNRGRCVYSCREAAELVDDQGQIKGNANLHPFSLKDLALKEKALDLASAGVDSLKIEGRKKSPLYVAATVDYYRRLLDGRLGAGEKIRAENRLKTIFARPWTDLFFGGGFNPGAVDTEVVGHRGAPLGSILRLVDTPAGPGIVFQAGLDLERHDGLQIDLPGQERPYGFGVDRLFRPVLRTAPAFGRKGRDRAGESSAGSASGRWEAVYEIKAGEEAAVTLPADAPRLQPGMALYLSSSQEVKRSFPYPTPKAATPGREVCLRVKIRVAALTGKETGGRGGENQAGETVSAAVVCEAECSSLDYMGNSAPEGLAGKGRAEDGETGSIPPWRRELLCDAFSARDAAGAAAAARGAFERLGESRFVLQDWRFDNPDNLFVKPGVWNGLRREMTEALEAGYRKIRGEFLTALAASVEMDAAAGNPGSGTDFSWSIAVDGGAQLDAFTAGDLAEMEEIVVSTGMEADFLAEVGQLSGRLGVNGDRIRLAMPVIIRGRTAEKLPGLIRQLCRQGFRRWLVPGLNGWGMLTESGAMPTDGEPALDLAADWPLYVTNSWSARALLASGFSSFSLSLEDEAENMRELAGRFPERAVATIYARPPLFISAACVHGHLGRCSGHAAERAGATESDKRCRSKNLVMQMERGGLMQVIPVGCGSVVYGAVPFALTDKLAELWELGVRRVRVDLRGTGKNSAACLDVWRRSRAGAALGPAGNFNRGWR